MSLSSKNNYAHFSCPICFNTISEATITRCGHTYCSKCIQKSIEFNKKCPKCNQSCSTQDTFPNFLLNELISKHNQEQNEKLRLFSASQSLDDNDPADNLKTFLASESGKLSLPDVNVILEVLTQRKVLLEAESITAQNKLLHEFLERLLNQTEQQQSELDKKVRLIKADMQVVEGVLKETHRSCPKLEDVEKHFENDPGTSSEAVAEKSGQLSAIRNEMKQLITDIGSAVASMPDSETKDSTTSLSQSSTYKVRKQKMFHHFDDFVKCYFNNRSEDLHFQNENEPEQELMITETNETAQQQPEPAAPKVSKSLDLFRENLVKFSKYSSLRTLSTLNYSNDNNVNPSTIVSSIEFDKDNEFFAIAGVTKRIKIFDYYACVRDAVVDIKHPINEMICTSKISCVAWNSYYKELLASSDYEGIVTVYDVETRARKRTFQEHDKRCWSVDFNEIDTKLLASGSDDARVKLWSIDCENSVATLEVKTANVCCVKFNPKSSCHLAFGSADHCVHYYDLRSLKEPLCIFKVRFNGELY
jgi:E3 ubiquitin-protein ligase RFWD2